MYNHFFLAAAAIVTVVCVLLRYTKAPFAGFLFFLLTVFPSLQFVPLGPTIVADRYTYIPSLGVFFVIFWFFTRWCAKSRNRAGKAAAWAAVILAAGCCWFATERRCGVWENDLTLWNDVLSVGDEGTGAIAYFNRGIKRWQLGDEHGAFTDFRKALDSYYASLRLKQDVETYDALLRSGKSYADVFNLMGIRFAEVNRGWEAEVMFGNIMERFPADVPSRINACVTRGNNMKYREAIAAGEEAVRLAPDSGIAHFNLAVAYYHNRQYGQARAHSDAASRLGFPVPGDFLLELESVSEGER